MDILNGQNFVTIFVSFQLTFMSFASKFCCVTAKLEERTKKKQSKYSATKLMLRM